MQIHTVAAAAARRRAENSRESSSRAHKAGTIMMRSQDEATPQRYPFPCSPVPLLPCSNSGMGFPGTLVRIYCHATNRGCVTVDAGGHSDALSWRAALLNDGERRYYSQKSVRITTGIAPPRFLRQGHNPVDVIFSNPAVNLMFPVVMSENT